MTWKYNWQEVDKKVQEFINQEDDEVSINKIAEFLGYPYGTVYDAVQRGDIHLSKKDLPIPTKSSLPLQTEYSGNDVNIKFRSAEPLTENEVIELCKLDLNKWKVVNFRVNMWQVGAKAEKKDLTFTNGVIDGTIESNGKLTKEYLYQIELKATLLKPVAIEPVFEKIRILSSSNVNLNLNPKHNIENVLFLTDTHFGYTEDFVTGKLKPFHNREMLSILLQIAKDTKPTAIVHGGDLLDMTDWQDRFPVEPASVFKTQLAGIECVWFLNKLFGYTNEKVITLGNHDNRMNRALMKNMQVAYDIRPIHDLFGSPLMSIETFLGLDKMGVEVFDYPDGSFTFHDTRFIHGDIVRKGSGSTSTFLAKDRTMSLFFGHIHRRELVSKYIEDLDKEIWVGSPGCLCNKEVTPGGRKKHNWQVGSFMLEYKNKQLINVIPITMDENNETYFGKVNYKSFDYLPEFLMDIPAKYKHGGLL